MPGQKPLYHAHIHLEMEFWAVINDKIPVNKRVPDLQRAYREALKALLQDKETLHKFVLLEIASQLLDMDEGWYEELSGVEGDTSKLLAPLLDKITVQYPGEKEKLRLPHWAGEGDTTEGYVTDNIEKCLEVGWQGDTKITFHE